MRPVRETHGAVPSLLRTLQIAGWLILAAGAAPDAGDGIADVDPDATGDADAAAEGGDAVSA